MNVDHTRRQQERSGIFLLGTKPILVFLRNQFLLPFLFWLFSVWFLKWGLKTKNERESKKRKKEILLFNLFFYLLFVLFVCFLFLFGSFFFFFFFFLVLLGQKTAQTFQQLFGSVISFNKDGHNDTLKKKNK